MNGTERRKELVEFLDDLDDLEELDEDIQDRKDAVTLVCTNLYRHDSDFREFTHRQQY